MKKKKEKIQNVINLNECLMKCEFLKNQSQSVRRQSFMIEDRLIYIYLISFVNTLRKLNYEINSYFCLICI